MNKRVKLLVILICVTMLVASMSVGFAACDSAESAARKLNELADETALFLLGNDANSWNTLSINPKESFGYERSSEPKWYSYSRITDTDIKEIRYAFNYLNKKLSKIKSSKLSGSDLATYYTLKQTLSSYIDYYGSEYAKDFQLIDGGYINSQGGYVADFTSAVENYALRNQDDVQDLLSMTLSCKDSFATYLDYARDRAESGYPLYDSSINGMIEYLDEVSAQGDNYYLYDYVNGRIDGSAFLSDSEKINYKDKFRIALKGSFMPGVKALARGLTNYRGYVKTTNKSYLAAYGNKGKELYKWLFANKTGADIDLETAYLKLFAAYDRYNKQAQAILEEIESIKDTNTAVYDKFNAYASGEKKLLDLTDPEEILSYLKTAANDIVTRLNTMPEIDFKYMDDTVAKRTPTIAYYILSPVDEQNSTEHITLNPYYIENMPEEILLTTIAHEGYPGHLYAYVNAKEKGAVMLLYTLGEALQDAAVSRSRSSVASLLDLKAEHSNLVNSDGSISVVETEELAIGDVVLIKAGERVPADATVIEGESFLDCAALTGEGVPVRVKEGDKCMSGAINKGGAIKARVDKEYADSTAARIMKLVEE